MKATQTIKRLKIVFIILALTLATQACAASISASDETSNSNNIEFQISFKLDERILGPTYGGPRWVPPPFGPVTYSGSYTLEARTYYISEAGQQVAVSAEWVPANPNLVEVSPGKGDQVAITVKGIGKTSLLVKNSQGTSQTLYIKSSAKNDLIQMVEIFQ